VFFLPIGKASSPYLVLLTPCPFFCLGTARYEQQFHMVQGGELGEAANQFGDRQVFDLQDI